MNIYKLIPFKAHRWLILHFGKPRDIYCGCSKPERFYQLNNWIASQDGNVYKKNVFEIYLEFRRKIAETLEVVCK